MVPDIIKRHGEQAGIPIRRVTNVCTICDAMNSTIGAKTLCTEILQLFLTVPVTASTSERTFSTLRRAKTFLRSSMTQERLNHLFLLHWHKTKTDVINISEVAAAFVGANNNRWSKYFGTVYI